MSAVELFAAPTTLKTRLISVPLPAMAVVLNATICTVPGVVKLGVTFQPALSVPTVSMLTALSTAGL